MGKTAAELTFDERRYYAAVLRRSAVQVPSGDSKNAMAAARRIAGLFKNVFSARCVWLFGSLSGGTFGKHSDIDIGVMGVPDNSFYRSVARAQSVASPFDVDVVDLDHCPPHLREKILSEGIVL